MLKPLYWGVSGAFISDQYSSLPYMQVGKGQLDSSTSAQSDENVTQTQIYGFVPVKP